MFDPDVRWVPEQAVWIELGETVCLKGTVLDTGHILHLRVYDEDDETGELIEISLLPRRDSSLLLVRHSSQRPLRYKILRLPRPGTLAVPDHGAIAESGNGSAERLSRSPRRIALTGLHFEREGPQPRIRRSDPVPPPGWRRHRSTGGAGVYLLGGVSWMDLPDVDRLLLSHGYSRLTKTWPQFGGGFFVSTDGWKFGWEGTTGSVESSHQQDSRATKLRYSQMRMFAGRALCMCDVFSADVLAGIGMGGMSMSKQVVGALDPYDHGRIAGDVWHLFFGHSARHKVRFTARSPFELSFGYQVGYARQLGGVSWDEDEASEWPVPSVDVSGPRAYVWLGLEVF